MAITKLEQELRLGRLISSLQNQNFFGEAHIKMQQGNIVQVVISQSIKLDEPNKAFVHETTDK